MVSLGLFILQRGGTAVNCFSLFGLPLLSGSDCLDLPFRVLMVIQKLGQHHLSCSFSTFSKRSPYYVSALLFVVYNSHFPFY